MLRAKHHATITGRFRWEVLAASGEVERAGECPNLITDQGMNNIGNGQQMDDLREWLHVGDGTTAPSNGDTSLANEIATTTTEGDDDEDWTESIDGTNDEMVWSMVRQKVYTASGSQNVSEIGFSNTGGAGDLNIRALLRDGGGSPTSVSLLDGKKLRITHTMETRMSTLWQGDTVEVEEYDVGGSLVATHGGAGGLAGAFALNSNHVRALLRSWWPGSGFAGMDTALAVTSDTTDAAGDPVTAVLNDSNSWLVEDESDATFSWDSYTPGSHERTRWLTVNEDNWNGTLWGWWITNTDHSSTRSNRALAFVMPSSFGKANTQTLKVGFTATWARAA